MYSLSAAAAGATLVIEGSPLRAMSVVSIDPPHGQAAAALVSLVAQRIDDTAASLPPLELFRIETDADPTDRVAIVAREIESVRLPPGPYELTWTLGDDELDQPECLWVVDAATYQAIWRERTDEDFAGEPVLESMDDVKRLLEGLDYRGLHDPRAPGGRRKPLFSSQKGFPSSGNIAASPFRWFMQGLLDSFALFLPDPSSMRWYVEITRQRVLVTLSSSIWLPVTGRTRDLVLHPTYGIASLLNRDQQTQDYLFELQADEGATSIKCLLAYRPDIRGKVEPSWRKPIEIAPANTYVPSPQISI